MTRDYLIAKVWKGSIRHEINYLESGYAIHNTPKAGIEITTLHRATQGRDIEWTTLTGPYMTDQEILNRANALKPQKDYSVTSYNCEDFVRELLGLPRSSPTRNKIIIGGIIVAVAGAIANSR